MGRPSEIGEPPPSSDPPADTDGDLTAPAARNPDEFARGDIVGRYVILTRVGAGGSGVVYRAYDPELDRAVAIKLVRSVRGRRERFLREAQALAQLSHPNVIAIHDVGTYGEQVFLAMEFVEGTTLREWMKSRPPLREILRVFLAAGRGLEAAHQVGMIHRDVKPDNVLVGADGRVRVVDFGLARAANVDDEPAQPRGELDVAIDTDRYLRASLTVTGAMLGTPRYMAPEQHLGRPTDARTDQFGFCVALYQALYGVRPFDGDSVAEIAAAVTTGEIDDPPAESKVPARLRRVVARGLSVEPAARWPSMTALLAALEDAYAAPRRRRVIAALVAVALVPAAAMAAFAAGGEAEAQLPCASPDRYLEGVWDGPARARVRAAFHASTKPYADDTYGRVLGHLDRYAERWTEARAAACVATRAPRVERTTTEVTEVRIACLNRHLRALGATTDLLGRAPDLIDHAVDAALRLPPIEECDEARLVAGGAVLPTDDETRARIAELGRQLEEARALAAAARYEPALELARTVLVGAEALPYLPFQAEVHHEVGRLHDHLEELPAARRHHAEAARRAARIGDDGLAASALAAIHRDDFDLEREAGRSGEAALAQDVYVDAAFERVDRDDARYADYLMVAGDMRRRLERLDEALPYFERALALRERVFGDADPRVAEVLIDLAASLPAERRAEHDAALARALAIYERALGPDHPAVGETLNRIAHDDDYDLDRAIAAYDRAGAIFAGAFGADDWQVGRSLNNSGEALCLRDEVPRGLERLERGLAIYERAFGADHCHLAYPLDSLAICHLRGGAPERAIEVLERGLAACDGKGLHPAEVHEMRFRLAQALAQAGREQARALDLAREARLGYLEHEGHARRELREIDAWLAAHGEPRSRGDRRLADTAGAARTGPRSDRAR